MSKHVDLVHVIVGTDKVKPTKEMIESAKVCFSYAFNEYSSNKSIIVASHHRVKIDRYDTNIFHVKVGDNEHFATVTDIEDVNNVFSEVINQKKSEISVACLVTNHLVRISIIQPKLWHVQVGNEDKPALEEDIRNIQVVLSRTLCSHEIFCIVTNHTIDANYYNIN